MKKFWYCADWLVATSIGQDLMVQANTVLHIHLAGACDICALKSLIFYLLVGNHVFNNLHEWRGIQYSLSVYIE